MRTSLILLSTFTVGLVSTLATFAVAQAEDLPAKLPENSVLMDLETGGVTLSEKEIVKLPAPTFSEGMTKAEEEAAIKEVAGRNPLSQFTRDSRVAPFNLKLESVYENGDKKKRVGRTIDLYFITHGDLSTIDEQKLLQDLTNVGNKQGPNAKELTAEDLKTRGIDLPEATPSEQWQYSFAETDLFNLVQVDGVTRMLITRSKDAKVVAGYLDPTFDGDAQFPNQWRHQKRNNLGNAVLGPPNAYEGFGGYAKATQLQSIENAIMVEVHLAFCEPFDWFDGKALLSTKLPLAIQTNVRQFRDTVSNLAKNQPAPK